MFFFIKTYKQNIFKPNTVVAYKYINSIIFKRQGFKSQP